MVLHFWFYGVARTLPECSFIDEIVVCKLWCLLYKYDIVQLQGQIKKLMLSDSLVVQGPDKSGPQLLSYFLLGLQNGVK